MKEASILLVEDNLADVVLVREALKDIGAHNVLLVAHDSRQAVKMLDTVDLPGLILLDIELPGTSGLKFLKQIKNDDRLKEIPVVVMSASQDAEDIALAYHDHANSYIVKPVDYERLRKTMRSIEEFWLDTAQPPPSSEGVS